MTGGIDLAALRALKEQDGRTWGQIAEAAGFSTSFLMDIAGGRSDPTTSRLVALARALDVSVLALLDTDENRDEIWLAGWSEGVLAGIRSLQDLRGRGPS